MSAQPAKNKQDSTWLHLSLLVAAILIAYSKIFHAGFMSWDDMDYVFHTPDIRSGIGWQQVSNWFSQNYIGNYQPLPVATYAIDHLLGGDNPFIYHLDSLLWHIADAVLVYFFIGKLQGSRRVALVVALLFALHPVQTESVSWIAARNKVMNAFFYLSALLLYVSYVKSKKAAKLVWVSVLGFLAYLCKATALSLPLALFAVDIWLQRPLRNKKIWVEKLPLVLLAIPIAWVTLRAQQQVSFLGHVQAGGMDTAIYAGYAYVQYIVHLLCPVGLSVLYPYPAAIGFIHILYFAIAIGILALMVIAYRRKWYVLSGGLLFYTVNMLPVLQFVQFGEELMADRYLYIACIGIWFPIIYYLLRFLEARRKQMLALSVSGVVAALFLTLTYMRNDIWLSEINFWNSVLDNFPESAVAQYSVGGIYMREGNYSEAEQHMDEAVKLGPGNYKAWYNEGVLYLREGKTVNAMEALNHCIAINKYPKAYFSRAIIYEGMGQAALALSDIEKTLEDQPQNPRAWYIKGNCMEQQGNMEGALEDYNNAIRYQDNEPLFYIRRGLIYAKTNQNQAALNDLDAAVRLNPNDGAAWYFLGMVVAQSGQSPCDDFRKALQLGYKQAQAELAKGCK